MVKTQKRSCFQAQADQGLGEAGFGERAGDLAAAALHFHSVHGADRHPGRGPRVQRRVQHDAVDHPRAQGPGPRRRGLLEVQHRQDTEDQKRQALGTLLAPVSFYKLDVSVLTLASRTTLAHFANSALAT